MDTIIHYGSCWFIYEPIYWILCKINLLIRNWGFSIIILTIVIKFILLPLSYISYKTIIKIRKLKPILYNIEKKYKKDKNKITEEIIKIYKKEKIHPLNSCLPIIIQTPIFISFYWTLTKSIELKNSPFILWIQDLSLMDPYFILPIIMGLSILLQQKINNKYKKNNILQILPILFTLFFLWFPSCLLIYWITNNIISIIQQYFIIKKYE
ncbi:Membrane protein insertase YidC [Candidatus Portiera aleyrodidarum]|uniref:Membrane protein insertase n=1 Tax=Candidatus Portiera aleyrodidarum TV TaxID=1297582 RepID=A0A8D3X7P9_9GAMM|nr:membrane protein insertase YidC [Candidatus Portiera aleyrodidarum]AGI27238.1 membrane protein insertase [Candidatus Portiera aleyrodidarum TV]CEI59229.1 Membrane protein insertase YidC [Candidatus Portiera aleyrodidarum]